MPRGRVRRPILTAVVLAALALVPGMGPHIVGLVAASEAFWQRPSGVPTFQADPVWPKLPAKWKLGDVSSVAVDAQDTRNLHNPADAFVCQKTNEVFIADGYGNRRVIVLDADTGAFKRMWGGFGNKPVDSDRCPPETGTTPSVTDGPGPDQLAIVHAGRGLWPRPRGQRVRERAIG